MKTRRSLFQLFDTLKQTNSNPAQLVYSKLAASYLPPMGFPKTYFQTLQSGVNQVEKEKINREVDGIPEIYEKLKLKG